MLWVCRNESSTDCRSVITAASSIRGTASAQRSTCRNGTFRAIEDDANGPRPCRALDRAINEIARKDELSPPTPRRRVAQSNSGNGRYTRAAILCCIGIRSNTTTLVKAIAHHNSIASISLCRLLEASDKKRLEPKVMIVGANVNSARTVANSQVFHNNQ